MRARKTATVAISVAVLCAAYFGSGAVAGEPEAARSLATASSVAVTRSGETLTIIGDDGPNLVQVQYSDSVSGGKTRVEVITGDAVIARFDESCDAEICPVFITRVNASLRGGTDQLFFDGSTPAVDLDLGAGDDVVRSPYYYDRFSAGPGNDLIRGIEADGGVKAGPGKDKIIGNEFDDKLFGGPGKDELIGLQGDDVLNGGAGHDVCRGGGNVDSNEIKNVPDRAPGCEVKSGIP
jgi:Ca2+-binding RTX toxin-like protein